MLKVRVIKVVSWWAHCEGHPYAPELWHKFSTWRAAYEAAAWHAEEWHK